MPIEPPIPDLAPPPISQAREPEITVLAPPSKPKDTETGWSSILRKPIPSWTSRHSFLVRLGWISLNLVVAGLVWLNLAHFLPYSEPVTRSYERLGYSLFGGVILFVVNLLLLPFEKTDRKDWDLTNISFAGIFGSAMFMGIMHFVSQLGWTFGLSIAYVVVVALLGTIAFQQRFPTPTARIRTNWIRVLLAIVAFGALFSAAQPDVWRHFFHGAAAA